MGITLRPQTTTLRAANMQPSLERRDIPLAMNAVATTSSGRSKLIRAGRTMSEKINWPASSGYCVTLPFFQLARPLAPIQSVPSRAATARGNPARLIKIPRAPEGDETHSYSLRDVETMLPVLPEPAAAVCAVAAFAGLRRSELRGVCWEDYDREQIMVMRSIWGGFTNDPKNKQQIAGSSHPPAASDRCSAQACVRKSKERANVRQWGRKAREPEQHFESENLAGAELLRRLPAIEAQP